MRIIAGDLRGVRLKALPGGEVTRPTLDRVKEGMFSALHFGLPGARVADLFAGSGQLGLEALSRGAASCTFVDDAKAAAGVIRENLRTAGVAPERAQVLCAPVEAFLQRSHDAFDVILLDPPYRQQVFPGLLAHVAARLAPGGTVLCETEPGVPFPPEIAGLCLQKQYRYGTVQVTRYTLA